MLVGRDREHDDLHLRVALPDLAEAGQPVGARHAEVEEHEIGLGAPDHRQNLGAGRRFSDHLEVARLLERPLDPVDDQLVVVGDEDSHACLTSSSGYGDLIVVRDPDDGYRGAA